MAKQSGWLKSGAGDWIPGLCITAAVMLIRFFGILQPLEWKTLDLWLRWRPAEPQDTRIVLVTITEEDIQSILGDPISDLALAELVQSLQNYNPRAIGLDIFRDRPVGEGYETLEKVLKASTNFVAINKIGGDVPVQTLPFLTESQVGFADAVTDDDGYLRRAQLAEGDSNNDYQWSFTIRLVEAYLELENISLQNGRRDFRSVQFGDTEIPHFYSNTGGYVRADEGGNQTLIHYRAGRSPFDEVTYSEILSGGVDRARLNDKILIVGYSALSTKDFVSSGAVSNYDYSLVPGIAIQAHAVSQILSAFYDGRPFLRALPDGLEYGLILAVGLMGTMLIRYRQKTEIHFMITAILIGICLLLFYGALLLGWWLPTVPVVLVAGLNAVVLYPFYQVQHQLKVLVEEKERLIDQTYAIVHNESLQTVAEMRRDWNEGETISAEMRETLNQLNNELRSIKKILKKEVLSPNQKVVMIGEGELDLQLPLHELLQQTYDMVGLAHRDFFKSVSRRDRISAVDDRTLSQQDKRDLCRFLQEALINVRKHGKGVTEINVESFQEKERNIIRVTDNGVELNQFQAPVNGRLDGGGEGTQQAERLAAQLSGRFSRTEAEASGTLCELRWPIRRPLLKRWRL